MKKAINFEFLTRVWKEGTPDMRFSYRVMFEDGEEMDFFETLKLSEAATRAALPPSFRTAILEDLHLILGISYYKIFCPPKFQTDILFSEEQAFFWNTVYRKGLGEFLYRNGLSPKIVAQFNVSPRGSLRERATLVADKDRVLIGIGGGKDSIVALDLLKDFDRTGFVVETGRAHAIPRTVAEKAGVPLVIVERQLDPKLLAGIPGGWNGHVPVSAMYAFLGVLSAACGGYGHVVVANEYSSNFGNIIHEGEEINHKWSGSTEFEALFQTYVHNYLTPSIRYFSITRPFYELRIVKRFAENGSVHFKTFSSCNRNFLHNSNTSLWCGACPKCAFVFLTLSAFLVSEEVVDIFGKDLFEDDNLLPLYKDLLGFGNLKPFDCVGTFDESRVALAMAAENGRNESFIVRNLLSQLGDLSTKKDEIFRTHPAPTVPSRFRIFGMESALILGWGREGRATERYLNARFPALHVDHADQADDPEYLRMQERYDVVFRTPSLPLRVVTRPSLTGTELFFSIIPRGRIIGVTGSKGKSTTASLIRDILKRSERDVRLIGNIGVPALDVFFDASISDETLFVFELSSYQLEDLDVSPGVAVVTALFPEHLDHHSSVEEYYSAKRNIVRFQEAGDVYIHADGFPLLNNWEKETSANVISLSPLPFSLNTTKLSGEHNEANVQIAYAVGKWFGINSEIIKQAVEDFTPLPHRLARVGTFSGITFYDDAISTTPESTIAALRAFGLVHTILLGGLDRGLNFNELEHNLRLHGVKTVILFPETGERLLSSKEGLTILHTEDMDEAVKFAYMHTPKGEICLLSPAAPSYNLFRNFEERGDRFVNAVKRFSALP